MSTTENKSDVRSILAGLGYSVPGADVYDKVVLWRAWYQGYHKEFHAYYQYNGKRKVPRKRKSLGMAKKVCEDHANLLLNEKVQLKITPAGSQKAIEEALAKNHFRVKGNQLVERAFALGTGAFVEATDGDGGVFIDYVSADMIFPLVWEGTTVTQCAFASRKTVKGMAFIYLNIHELDEQKNYVVKNKYVAIPSEGVSGKARMPDMAKASAITTPNADGALWDGTQAEVFTGSPTRRFQFIGPNQANNIVYDSPMGCSVFANSLDVLEGIDLVFDSYCGEFRLGKKRIIVPMSMLQLLAEDGTDEQFLAFDDNDTEFYGMRLGDGKEAEKPHEINMELRHEAHEAALQRFLNLLSDKCQLGNDRYNFVQGTAKTATEVVSEKSDLFQNLQKNELVMRDALIDLCMAIGELIGKPITAVEVEFDDSIIEDTTAKRARFQQMTAAGQFPLWRYLHEYEGYSEADAKAIEAEVKAALQPSIGFEDDPNGSKGAVGGPGGVGPVGGPKVV